MEKRKLSAIAREKASEDMMEIASRLKGMRHIVTAQMVEDNRILLLTFYNISDLANGKEGAAFRTFLSNEDYITQDLRVEKVKWLTASFYMMNDFSMYESTWSKEKNCFERKELIFIRSNEERDIIITFFKEYADLGDTWVPWSAVNRFQKKVKAARLAARHKKEIDLIDAVMETVKQEPEEFRSWAFDSAMSFSRYLIYQEIEKGIAQCECTHCGKIGPVNRTEIRLRNNEKGICPFCGSKVTIKAKGKLPYRIKDERWVVYVDPTYEGFIWRYFHVYHEIHKYPEETIGHKRISQGMKEYGRQFYSFHNGKPECDSYEYAEFKQSGKTRWCHGEGRIPCWECVLYPGNLPQAWEHTPMKYSALEILSENMPTISLRYERGIQCFLEFQELEWICKMGLNQLAKGIINATYQGATGKIDMKGGTIYKILGLNKVNTKILQAIDGNYDELRLLQAAQMVGLQLKPDQLKQYYETFGCNTDLLKQANRKVSLHKLVKYIGKESERYPLGEKYGCGRYVYMRYQEREDPRIERKRNMAGDWLEYLDWCKALKYDLDNLFIYMPTNFKKVHDRTAKEYQALQNKRATAERKRQETLARKRMEQTQKAIEEIFKKNEGTDAFSIKGKGLILVVPKNGDEIKAEGEALHHCVGGYVSRVASGETNIFFVRKAEAPEKPYFTLEYRDNRVIQCRGLHNCDMPLDVKAFVKVFEKKMQDFVLGNCKSKRHRKAG